MRAARAGPTRSPSSSAVRLPPTMGRPSVLGSAPPFRARSYFSRSAAAVFSALGKATVP